MQPQRTSVFDRMAVRDWRAVATLFCASTVLESLALGHLNAFTPLFLRNELRMEPGAIAPWTGALAAITFAVAFPLSPFWGALAERYSRKLIIVRSQYLEAIAYGICAFAPDLQWFVIGRLLLGLTFGNIAIVIATQSLLTPERKVASAISIVQAMHPIAASFGPPLGALLIPSIGTRGLFLADAATALTAAVLITFFMPEPEGRDKHKGVVANMRGMFSTVWRRPALRWNFSGWFLSRGAVGVLDSYLPVRIAEVAPSDPAGAIGLVLGVHGALTTVATWITGRVVDRFGAARMFWPGMLLASLCVAGTAFAPWLWLVAVLSWVRSVPSALTSTVLYAHLAQVLRREERVSVMSLTPLPRNVASFVLPVIAAAAATLGTGPALMVAAASYGLAAWVGRRLLDVTTEQPTEQGGAESSEAPAAKVVR